MKTRFLGWSALALLAGAATTPVHAAYTWKNVKIVAGGYVPGVAFHPTPGGPAYIRTDVGGSYRMASNGKSWTPLNDMFTDGGDMGSVAIGLDPDDTNSVYLTGGLSTDLGYCGRASFFRSSDRGNTWTRVPLDSATVSGADVSRLNGSKAVCLGGNDVGRGMGPRIAAKGSTIYLATNRNGLIKSVDRGNTWTTALASVRDSGVGSVAFDKNGGVFMAPYTGGVFKSTDGSSWTRLAGLSGVVFQMSYDKTNDKFWLTVNDSNGLDQGTAGKGSVWTLDAANGTFSQVATLPAKGGKDFGYGGISANPSNPLQVVVATNGWWRGKASPAMPDSFVPHEAIYMTRDGGGTWTDIADSGTFDAASAQNSATNNPHWISGLAIDPANPDHIVFGTGYGVWSTFDATAAHPTWIFTDENIEETVVLGMVSSSYGAPLVSAIGDIDGYYHEDLTKVPASRHQVEAGTNFDISMAALAPNKMIRIYKETKYGLGAYSEDGGRTWTRFASYPPFVASPWSATYTNETNYAAISADGSSIVWNMQKHGVYYSKNNGATWTASSSSPSLFASDSTSFHVAADQKTPGTFYIYNGGTGKLLRSIDHGATWASTNDTLEYGASWTHGWLRVFPSPKAAGEVWLTQGVHIYNCFGQSWCGWPEYDGSGLWIGKKAGDANVVYRSVDGGKTLAKVSGLLYASYIGFGKGLAASSPAVYALGMNSQGVGGLFRSTDDGASWTRIDDPLKQFGGFSRVIGDPCVYSRVYLTTNGRGLAWGEDGANVNSCPDRVENGGGGTGVSKRTASSGSRLARDGMVLRSSSAIDLMDVSGRIVRRSAPAGDRAVMDLHGIHGGLYLARSGSVVLKITLQ